MFIAKYFIKIIYLAHSIVWLFFSYYFFKKSLEKKYGISKIGIYKFLTWHQGCFYFTGNYANLKVFIKTDFYLGLIQNERACNELLKINTHFSEMSSPLIAIHDKFAVYSFLDGQTLDRYLLSNRLNTQQVNELALLLHQLLDMLFSAKIIHRDFIPRNVFVTSSGQLILIDFYFAKSLEFSDRFLELKRDSCLQKLLLSHLGMQKSPYVWDDSYSIIKGLEVLQGKVPTDLTPIISSLESKVGRLEYTLSDMAR